MLKHPEQLDLLARNLTVIPLSSEGTKTIMKKHLKGAYVRIVFLFLIALLWSGCSDEQQFLRNSQVETTFQLKSGSGLNGAFTIQHAYLKLQRVVISGTSADRNVPEATLAIPEDEPPFRLVGADSSHITLTLPARKYDMMDLHLFLIADQYELVLSARPEDYIPEPVGSSDGGPGGAEENPDDGISDDDGQNEDGRNTDSGTNTGSESDEDGGSRNGDRDDDENTEDDDREDDDQEDDDQEDDDKDRNDGDDNKKNDDDKKKGNKGKKAGDDKANKGKKNNDKDDGKGGRRSQNASNETVDLDDFFQNARPGIVIFGTLVYNTQKINFIFVVTDPAEISVRAMQGNGSGIVLEEHNSSVVSFDAEQWVAGLTEKDLEGAVIQLYQGQAVLFIHKDFNAVLFEKLFSRLMPSATFRFDSAVAE